MNIVKPYKPFKALGYEARLYYPMKRSIAIVGREPWYVVFPHTVFARVEGFRGVLLAAAFTNGDSEQAKFIKMPLLNIACRYIVCLGNKDHQHYSQPSSKSLSDLIEMFWQSQWSGVIAGGWRLQQTPEDVLNWLRQRAYDGEESAREAKSVIQMGAGCLGF